MPAWKASLLPPPSPCDRLQSVPAPASAKPTTVSGVAASGAGHSMSGIGLYREFFAAKPSRWIVLALSLASVLPSWLHSQPLSGAEQVEHGLEIAPPRTAKASRLDLRDALAALT